MINDGIKEKKIDSKIQVKDIAELLEENLNDFNNNARIIYKNFKRII